MESKQTVESRMIPSYITAEELLPLLLASPRRLVVIDVRDEDFEGGHIQGAINVPSREFSFRLEELVRQYASAEAVVFHCMYSQQRGQCNSPLHYQTFSLTPTKTL